MHLLLFLLVIVQLGLFVLFKFAADNLVEVSVVAIITNVLYLACFVLFFIRAILWQIVLAKVNLGEAYLTQSINTVTIMLVSYLIFGEEITISNIIGGIVISLGVLKLFK